MQLQPRRKLKLKLKLQFLHQSNRKLQPLVYLLPRQSRLLKEETVTFRGGARKGSRFPERRQHSKDSGRCCRCRQWLPHRLQTPRLGGLGQMFLETTHGLAVVEIYIFTTKQTG